MTEKIIGGEPRIIITGTVLRPYYQIEYYGSKDGNTHLGFGSRYLSQVQEYLNEFFEAEGR